MILALYSIGDLHLSFNTPKKMDKFGVKWKFYEDKIIDNWNKIIKKDDTVVVCGDISWAMGLEQALADLNVINELKGKKILLKGNHDYWWTTVNKMKNFLSDNHLNNIDFLQNNSFVCDDFVICGSRGWFPGEGANKEDDVKMYNREGERFRLSFQSADKYHGKQRIMFSHYPPAFNNVICDELFDIVKKAGITQWYYGHIHSDGIIKAYTGEFEGVYLNLVSSDSVDFTPVLVK